MSPLKLCVRGVFLAGLALSALAPAQATPPAAWRDDADLHAVQFLGKSIGWAVGDHGAALRTVDGGRTWEPRPVPADLSMRAVFFLTDHVGWAAGSSVVPYTQVEEGAVFRTDDAGKTWTRVNVAPLPRLHAIRFFGPEEGIAAGAAIPECPSGVLTTADGGATWSSLSTGTVFNPAGWRAAAFPASGRGAVVGPRGRRSLIGEGQLLAARDPTLGLRGLNAVVLNDRLAGWAAGDGGMVLQTENGGLVWQDPPAMLPAEARELFDLHAVSAFGAKVWAAGRPGSVVWHSSDGGRSWRSQATGSTLPIEAIRFNSDLEGVAVGAMGQILRTANGGATWQSVRGTDRRAALMTIASRPDGVSFPLLATVAGDQGYRSVAILPVRHDLGAADSERPNLDLRLHDAVVSAGANAAVTDWPLPLTIPGVDRAQDALVAEWNRRTEGNLERILVGRLAAAIRMWRPEVVVLEEPADGDAAAALVYQAAELAVAAAADPTRYLEHRLAALSPWQAKKVYVRTRSEKTADATIERDATLPRLGVGAADLAGFAASKIEGPEGFTAKDEFRLLPSADGEPLPGPFFAGLALAPGSAARRASAELIDDPRLTLLANRQRNLRAYATRSIDDPGQASAILAQIDELSAGLSPAQAAGQLRFLADVHRNRSRWDLAEQAYLSLIERYPQEPSARDAMTWLMRLWTGAEPVWRRMNDKGTTTQRGMASVESLEARVETAFRLAEAGVPAATSLQINKAGLGPDPLITATAKGALRVDVTQRWDDATIRHWRQQALRLAGLIRRVDPALFSTPAVQFPLAAVLRGEGNASLAYLRRFAPDLAGGGWQPAAAAELTLANSDGPSTVQTALCRRTSQPPHLDAVLSDPCWQAAVEMSFAPDPSAPLAEGGLALLSYDEKFLYIAASLPRVPGRSIPTIELAGRTHDAELDSRDRLIVSLDVDRDYATSYRFEIDERGQTAEACWDDPTWNPQWFVAVEGQDDRWRIEAAIPFSALGPRSPIGGEIWAVSVGRVVPAVGVEGWPRPTDGEPRPESFGLMRFE